MSVLVTGVRVGTAGVTRLVHLSSLRLIGADKPGTVTEETPCWPKNEYERTKLEGERAVLDFAGLEASTPLSSGPRSSSAKAWSDPATACWSG